MQTLSYPLHNLFSSCLELGDIPSEWKIHKICPVPKSGDLLCVENYRPISLLCITGKVLERIVYDKIIDFIRPKISNHQHGFLQNRSCLTQLLSSFAFIFDKLNNKSVVDVVYLDFKKAFDSVPHDELLFKLWRIGITGPLWHWFKAYLTGRFHYVSIDNVSSPLLPVLSGVPQGSILGPFLFLIYINDLPEHIEFASCYLLNFADDTKLLKAIKSESDEHILQRDVDTLDMWCKEWKLSLNANKSNTMRLTLSHRRDQQVHQYCIDGTDLQVIPMQQVLGVIVRRDLSWTDHYNNESTKGADASVHVHIAL